jgi:hypothetical protein
MLAGMPGTGGVAAMSARVLFLVGLVLAGCTPSVRYSRNPGANTARNKSHKVPPSWDYRKHYTVPPARLKRIVDSFLGTPYRYGGTSRRGMDCSGFVVVVFRKLNGAALPRSSRRQRRLGKPVSRNRAKAGDLVFFRGGVFNLVNHVGIYMGDGEFAHASSSKGVVYTDLDDEYFGPRFAGFRRLF